jgi:hypothetical protein
MATDTKGQTAGKCSVCKKHYKYVRQHERNVHKIYATKPRKASTALVKVETNHKQPEPLMRVLPFRVLLDESDGSKWIAERIG